MVVGLGLFAQPKFGVALGRADANSYIIDMADAGGDGWRGALFHQS